MATKLFNLNNYASNRQNRWAKSTFPTTYHFQPPQFYSPFYTNSAGSSSSVAAGWFVPLRPGAALSEGGRSQCRRTGNSWRKESRETTEFCKNVLVVSFVIKECAWWVDKVAFRKSVCRVLMCCHVKAKM